MSVLRWLVGLPLGLVCGIGVGAIALLLAAGTADGERLGLLAAGFGIALFPPLFAGSGGVRRVLRFAAVCLAVESLILLGLGGVRQFAANVEILGPRYLQWLHVSDYLGTWAVGGVGPLLAFVVLMVLALLAGLASRSASAAPPAAKPARTVAARPSPAALANPTPSVVAQPTQAVRQVGPAQELGEDAKLGADLASLRERLARINAEDPPGGAQ